MTDTSEILEFWISKINNIKQHLEHAWPQQS